MKKINCIILLLACMLTGALQAKRAVIMGAVLNTKAKTASTSYRNSLISYRQQKQTFSIDKKGNFKLVFDVETTQNVYMIIDEQQTEFYITPGDSITLKINYTDFDNSIVFGGNSSEKNNFFKAYNEKFMETEQQVYEQNARRTAASFAFYCDSLLNEKINFANKFTPKPNTDFIKDFKTTLVYESAGNKMQYAGFWSYARHKGDTLPDMPSDYYNFIKKLRLNNDTLLNNPSYLSFLVSIVDHYADDIARTSGVIFTPTENLQVAKTIFKNEKILQALEAELAYRALSYFEFAIAEDFYFNYIKNNANTPYSDELKEQYIKIQKISPGQPAPMFTLMDDKGKQCSITDFKGKVVYLDFWASWCGPCLRELPYSKKLKEAFAGKDVVFLYISIDENPDDWKKAITKHSISGTHLIAPDFEHAICKTYDVTGVPTYFLIGRDGRIVNNNPPRPSMEEAVKKEIAAALEK